MWLKKALIYGTIAIAVITSPYAIAPVLPTIESEIQIASAQLPSVQISRQTALQIETELSDLVYVNSFPEFSPEITTLINMTDCGSYAIAAAAKLYEKGYNPYIMQLEDDKKTQHWVALYHNGVGWGSIGGLEWDSQPPIHQSVKQLFNSLSTKSEYNKYFIFQFSPDIYLGYNRIITKVKGN
jgi:hypothetical protein